MKWGIDVSEHNGIIDWSAVKETGIEFVIVRLGWGRGHLDSRFYENVNGAMEAGLSIGVYYYSYALNEADAADEASFAAAILKDCGLTPEQLKNNVWLDMEDADGYKESHGVTDREQISRLCTAFIARLKQAGYDCGIYANLDWLENKIFTAHLDKLFDGLLYWVAQWSSRCDWPQAIMWQHTSCLNIGGRCFDGNILFE